MLDFSAIWVCLFRSLDIWECLFRSLDIVDGAVMQHIQSNICIFTQNYTSKCDGLNKSTAISDDATFKQFLTIFSMARPCGPGQSSSHNVRHFVC